MGIYDLKDKEYTDRNLKIYRKMILNNEKFSPREIFYYGNELYDNGYYIEAIEQYKKFIESDEGWVEDVKQAINKISDCYKYIGNDKEQIKYLLKALEYDIFVKIRQIIYNNIDRIQNVAKIIANIDVFT